MLRHKLGSSGAFSQSRGIGLWERKRTLCSFLHPLCVGTGLSLRFSWCCTRTHTCLYTQTYTQTHGYAHTDTHAKECMSIHICTHTLQRHTQRHTHRFRDTHTHIPTHFPSICQPPSHLTFSFLTFPQSPSTHSSRFLSFSIPLSIPTCRPHCKQVDPTRRVTRCPSSPSPSQFYTCWMEWLSCLLSLLKRILSWLTDHVLDSPPLGTESEALLR